MKSFVSSGARFALVLFILGATPTAARADWLLTPFVGVTFGGNAKFGDIGTFTDNFKKKVTFGGTLTWMGAGIIGLEADLGVTPDFFENVADTPNVTFGDSHVTTLMGNLVVGAPIGGTRGPGFRPYASGGIGLLRSNIDVTGVFDNLSKNDLGINVGAGAHIFFADHVGIRGDIRYFRSLQNDDNEPLRLGLSDFDFWRGTVGVTFRFGG